MNSAYKQSDLIGYRIFKLFGFSDTDLAFTQKKYNGLTATLLCANPYILNISGIPECANAIEVKGLKQEIEDFGRTERDKGLRRTGRLNVIMNGEGYDAKIARNVIEALGNDIIKLPKHGTPRVTSGFYKDTTEEFIENYDCSLVAHTDIPYAPDIYDKAIQQLVRDRRDFGHISPLSFKPSEGIGLSTLLYYPRHPEKGFEFVLPTLADPNDLTKPLEICPKPHDVLVMDNVKTFPFASIQNIILPATAAIHEVKHGIGEKIFVALFMNA